MFKRDVDFSRTTFRGDVDFLGVTFKNLTKFINVSFELAKFLHCIFEDITVFKRRETFSPDKNEVVIFNFVNFKNPQNTTFMDFPLSKISFLMTDVKDITIIAKAEEILSEKLLRYKEKEERGKINETNKNENFEKVIKILRPYLRQETVLAEYRNIRKSFEKNRTFVEASELFIKEMELLKKGLPWFEKAVYDFYYGLSKYGESIIRPIFWSAVFIFVYPLIILFLNYNNDFSKVTEFYPKCLKETLRAFFQLGIIDKSSLMISYEWSIRIISLILLSNLFIAIKRRLERV
nr:pentapeptide repeat-containing protein [Methanotorris igneus]